ncbi:MAG: hypothetical protein WDN48_02330 [Pseudolabrys sp.]
MRDHVTFTVSTPKNGLPTGNFAGYIDHENRFSIERQLPFPHVRATAVMTHCVLRIEREDHPEIFAPSDSSNMQDIDVTDLIKSGTISFDQNALPDSSKRK